MAIVYTNPTYPWQVGFAGKQAPSTQLNYRQMLSEVTSWNPNVDPMTAGRWINNYYRKVMDMRSWYGLKIKGQVSVRKNVNSGQVVTTYGNPFVTGVGTTWDPSLVGLQFRSGFTYNYQTITNVIDATHLQLDTPFAGAVGTNTTGYMIVDSYIDFGMNIKRMLWAVNQQQGWPMKVNTPQETINAWDVWRISLGWSRFLSLKAPSPAGGALWECWPTPFSNQVFPFEAYQQPPDLVNDDDAMVAWIPADLIVTRAVADALVYRGPRKNEYYDAQTSMAKKAEFSERVEQMAQVDNDLDQQDVSWDFGGEEGYGLGIGSVYSQSHD